jgi:hypothetical protein
VPNKQTAHINPKVVAAKVARGHAITVAELSVHIGVSYCTVRSWRWVPKIGRLIFWDDFVIARQRAAGLLQIERDSPIAQRPERPARRIAPRIELSDLAKKFLQPKRRGRHRG